MVTCCLAFGAVGEHCRQSVAPLDLDELNKDDIFFLDRFAADLYSEGLDRASDVIGAACAAMPILSGLIDFEGNDRVRHWTDFTMIMESLLLVQGLGGISKGLTHRARPFAYSPDVPLNKRQGKDAARSFFSLQTALAFNGVVMAALLYEARHPDSSFKRSLWLIGLSGATLTGVLRVAAGYHYPTDVLAGAVVGSAIGMIIPALHYNKKATKISLFCDGLRMGIVYSFDK